MINSSSKKTYTIIWSDGTRSLTKLTKKREKVLKKQKCSECQFSKTETGWIIKHIPENQGGGVCQICPSCGRVSQ